MQTSVEMNGDVLRVWEALSNDALRPLKEIASDLGIPYSRARRSIEWLVAHGHLQGYRAILNPFRLGLRHATLAFFRTNPSEPHIRKYLLEMPRVERVSVLSGTYSLMALVRCESRDSYEATLGKLDELVAQSRFKQSDYVSIIRTYKENGIPLPAENKDTNGTVKLDDKDKQILQMISFQKVSPDRYLPMPSTEIAKRLGYSQPSVHRRVKRLIEEGVILRIRSEPNPAEWNKDQFLIALKVDLKNSDHIVKHLLEDDRVVSFYRVGREYQFRVFVSSPSILDLREFLDRLYKLEGVIDTNTQIIFGSKISSFANHLIGNIT